MRLMGRDAFILLTEELCEHREEILFLVIIVTACVLVVLTEYRRELLIDY